VKSRLRLRLKECLAARERRTGRHLTYRELAQKSGLSVDTIKAIAARPAYNASLRTIERLSDALGVDPFELISTDPR
jgi:transcriptional regulator with XRE-family HTH domain